MVEPLGESDLREEIGGFFAASGFARSSSGTRTFSSAVASG
jgi:hypothetical protein